MNTTGTITFKDENRALQELARELDLLRRHNLQFREGAPQHTLLLTAEAALTCLTMEHFVRVVEGDAAPEGASELQTRSRPRFAEGCARPPHRVGCTGCALSTDALRATMPGAV
jgi:hypothetical protein